MELVTPDQRDALLEALEDQGRSCYCPVAVCARWILLAILQKRYAGTQEDGERDGAMCEPVLEDDGKQLEKQVRAWRSASHLFRAKVVIRGGSVINRGYPV